MCSVAKTCLLLFDSNLVQVISTSENLAPETQLGASTRCRGLPATLLRCRGALGIHPEIYTSESTNFHVPSKKRDQLSVPGK